jgi:hypothetical protein
VLEAADANTINPRDIDRISGISARQNGARIGSSNVTLSLRDPGYKWLPTNTATGVWRRHGVSPTYGFEPVGSEFTLYYAYILGDESEDENREYVAMFTGRIMDDPTFDSKSGVANIVLVGLAESKLEQTKATAVGTAYTDLSPSPASGDGSNLDFDSQKPSLWNISNVRVGGTVKTQGTHFTLDDLNDAEANAFIRFTTGNAPGAAADVLFDAKQWYRDKSISELVGLLCDEAGIGSSARTIEEPRFPGIDQSLTFATAADWAAGTLTNAEGLSLDGWLRRRWFSYFTGANTTGWTSYATAITSDGTRNAFGGNSTNGPVARFTVHDRGSGTFEMKVRQVVGAPYFMMVFPFGYRFGTEYGFSIETDAGGSGIAMVDSSRTAIGSGSSTLTPGVEHTIRYTLSPASGGSRSAILYLDGVQIATVTLPGSYAPDSFSVWNSNPGAGTGDCIEMRDCYFSNAVLTPAASSVETANMKWKSAEQDLLAAPSDWLPLEVARDLKDGALTFATDVASASGGPYDGEVAVNSLLVPQSNKKRYFKLVVESTITRLVEGPEVDSVIVNWRGTSLFIKSADFTDMTCLDAVTELAKMGGMEFGTKGDGTFYFRNRTVTGAADISLSQKNALTAVLAYRSGYQEVRPIAQVRYGKSGTSGYYFAEYKASDAGEASPTTAERFGSRPISLDLTKFIFSNNASVATAIAAKLYAENYYPKRRLRVGARIIPHLDTGDKVSLSFHDSPLIEQAIFGDPLQVYPVTGPNSRTLARDILMKVVGTTHDLIKSETVLDLEEVI